MMMTIRQSVEAIGMKQMVDGIPKKQMDFDIAWKITKEATM
jgi:hypothetical protein